MQVLTKCLSPTRMAPSSASPTRRALCNLASIWDIDVKSEEPTLLALPITSHLVNKVAEGALHKGWKVVGTSRNGEFKGIKPGRDLSLRQVQKVTDENAWKQFAEGEIIGGKDYVVLNGMGGAHPEKGKTLMELNVHCTLAAMRAITQIGHKRGAKIHFVQFSSVATEIESTHLYGEAKKEANSLLLNECRTDLTIMSVGYALDDPTTENTKTVISNHHHYSPEQVAKLPFHPTMSNSDYPLQPVAVKDITRAVLNSLSFPGKTTVFAVGPETFSQIDFFKFFTDLLGKKYRHIDIPFEAAMLLTKHFECGHFASYAADYCNTKPFIIDPSRFQERVGRELTSMTKLYDIPDGKTIEVNAPPIIKHTGAIAQKLWEDPQARKDLARALFLIAKQNL